MRRSYLLKTMEQKAYKWGTVDCLHCIAELRQSQGLDIPDFEQIYKAYPDETQIKIEEAIAVLSQFALLLEQGSPLRNLDLILLEFPTGFVLGTYLDESVVLMRDSGKTQISYNIIKSFIHSFWRLKSVRRGAIDCLSANSSNCQTNSQKH